ncbi:hypothetical protein NF27_AK00040 [Candidatus Jidaibacter acanthamoeba]|uniref:Protein-PII uridylyltransferase N-terminal domain-containing protein n=1 Tax=Candidatus Jidaibacter acanthamoebae TaxID=86105 RepID=A0A0C1MVK3_9RICK|nr:tetratricopeptide repeat protein [Candidatus Jidaibacter acanthamoeba]KIE06272.1 hypothetical protein NF27_AK00040 [Candidatus Jidaibacter acanthamoeba]
MQGRNEEIKRLYNEDKTKECLEKIKEGLKVCNNSLNAGKYYEQEYELFLLLGDIYYKGVDRSDYPKTVGIYQYILNIIDKLPDKINKEGLKKLVESKIGKAEEKFIKQYSNGKHLPKGYSGKESLEKIKKYKENLITFRVLIKDKLAQVESLEIKENEEGLERRAEEVEKIYGEIREYFIGDNGLIKQLLNDCIKELGGLPRVKTKNHKKIREVKYAIFGLGSMALGTMTPWSDMEWGILIEEGLKQAEEVQVKEYFRNLATLMYIKVCNFGESVLHYMGIKELNDISSLQADRDNWFVDKLSPKGFCFDATLPDGCKTPLGRQGHKRVVKEDGKIKEIKYPDFELLHTVENLLNLFQKDEKWKENDITLVQALWHIIPIIDNDNLIEKYKKNLKRYNNVIRSTSFQILREDIQKYNPRQQFGEDKEGSFLNSKKEIYRPSDRSIVALAGCFNNEIKTVWKLLEDLFIRKKISRKLAKNLKIALGLANRVRLETYTHYNNRNEQLWAFQQYELKSEFENNIILNTYHFKDTGLLYKFYNIMIAFYQLIEKGMEGKKIRHVLAKAGKIRIDTFTEALLCTRFLEYDNAERHFQKLIGEEKEPITKLYFQRELIRVYIINQKLDAALILSKQAYIDAACLHKAFMQIDFLWQESEVYKEKGEYENAKDCLSRGDDIINNVYLRLEPLLGQELLNQAFYEYQTQNTFNKAVIHKILGDYQEALDAYKELHQKIKCTPINVATLLHNMASCLHDMGNNHDALEKCNESLNILLPLYGEYYPDYGKFLITKGNILKALKENDGALNAYNHAAKISCKVFGKYDYTFIISQISIGSIYIDTDFKKFQDVKILYKHINKIVDAAPQLKNAKSILFNNFGNLKYKQGKFIEASEYYKESIKIKSEIFGEHHPEYALTLSNICTTFCELNEPYLALLNCLNALNVFKQKLNIDHHYFKSTLNNLVIICLNKGVYEPHDFINDSLIERVVEFLHLGSLKTPIEFLNNKNIQSQQTLIEALQNLVEKEITKINYNIIKQFILIKIHKLNNNMVEAEEALEILKEMSLSFEVSSLSDQQLEEQKICLYLVAHGCKELGQMHQEREFFRKIKKLNPLIIEV